MKRSDATYHGLLLVNKPAGMSSHDVVDHVRKLSGQTAVGHTGTLDPAAEGLLVMMLGKATKAARFLSSDDKEYEAVVRLGAESATYDGEGISAETKFAPVPDLNDAELERILDRFRGTITQQVPPFSAVQVDGERLYKKSRRGEEVSAPERTVTIETLDLISRDPETLRLRIVCSKGTYIRSLANDIGHAVGCGGYLASLHRTRCGRFLIGDSYTLDQLVTAGEQGLLSEWVIPIDRALCFSEVTVSDTFQAHVANGRRPRACDIAAVSGEFRSGDHVLMRDGRGSVLAIATAMIASGSLATNPDGEILKYDRVLA